MRRVIFLLMFISSAIWSSSIEGGFGYKLGDVFDTSTAISESKTTSGDTLYVVEAKKPIKYFKRYYVLTTPTTKKIREIWGIASYKEKGECVRDLEVISILLENKYGKLSAPSISMDVSKSVDVGERRVSIKCTGFMEFDLYLQYRDYDLNKLAKRETAEEDAKSIDASAL